MKIKILLLVIAVALFSACSYIEPGSHPLGTKNPVEEIPDNFVEAVVTKVVDGDTIYVDINGDDYKLRMIGLNCPEYTKEIEPYGRESSEYTENELLGKTVYLESDVSNTDKYSRLLRYSTFAGQ